MYEYGGPAFPHNSKRCGSGGMTLRDYFAAKAMHGLLANGHQGSFEQVAEESYLCADAMLDTRSSK
jgi:hypothetical protein